MKATELKFKTRQISYSDFISSENSRVIAFEYLIPRPLFPPVKRISKFYIFRDGESLSRIAFKYNLFNFIFGWIGLPFGPAYTINSYFKNKKGIDFTTDFKANVKEGDFTTGILLYEKVEELFILPGKSNIKELKKALERYSKKEAHFATPPIVGLRIDKEEPIYYLGISSSDFEHQELILKYLYKRFYKYTKFEFLNLNEESELVEKLKKQGTQLAF